MEAWLLRSNHRQDIASFLEASPKEDYNINKIKRFMSLNRTRNQVQLNSFLIQLIQPMPPLEPRSRELILSHRHLALTPSSTSQPSSRRLSILTLMSIKPNPRAWRH